MFGKMLMNWCRRQAAYRRVLGSLRTAGRPPSGERVVKARPPLSVPPEGTTN